MMMAHPVFGEPTFEQRGVLYVACIRRQVAMDAIPQFYDSAYPALFAALGEAGLEPDAAPLGIVYGEQDGALDLAVAVPVAEPFPGTGQVRGDSLPAARTALLTVVGDYAQLAEAHGYLQDWIAQQGEEPLGWAWEQYLTEPEPGGDPAANITQIGVGLAAR